jgi:Ca-activated chloride channel family protein
MRSVPLRRLAAAAAPGILLVACSAPPLPVATATPPPPPAEAAIAAPVAPLGPVFEVETTPAVRVVPADKPTELLVRVRLRGLTPTAAKRPALNLALVLDTSGSMEGPAIDQAREACGTLIDGLVDGDVLSLVTFGSVARVIVQATQLTAETRAKAHEALRAVVAEGTTDMSAGLQAGLEQVGRYARSDGMSRIVLVGDGVPNDPTTVPPLADRAAQMRIPITALGLGPDFEETLMTNLARRSGGAFHFVADAASVAKVLEEELAKVERVVAQGVYIDVTPGPGVTIEEALGGDPQALARGTRLSLGELKAGQSREAIVRVKVRAHHDGSKVELLDVAVFGTRVPSGVPVEARVFQSLGAATDAKPSDPAVGEELAHQAARLRAAQGLVQAIALARGGDVPGARALLDATAARAKKDGARFKDAELAAKAQEAAGIRKTLASLAPLPPDAPSRAGAPQAPPPAAPSAAESMQVKGAHAEAMKELQGD